MNFETTRRIARCGWTKTMVFDPAGFRTKVGLARGIRGWGLVMKMAEDSSAVLYEVERVRGRGLVMDEDSGPVLYGVERDPYLVLIDLTGQDAHYCTCPDGATRVEVAFLGGSLCEHVIACLLEDGNAHMLAPHFCLAARAANARRYARRYARLRGCIIR
jgi:hypothetical protein